ncbi:hypothetical protein LX97_02460 [Nonlabens dokdonensis]|jgi:hypothetical protein|uniref:Uncharacterized protein n=2 Tax=Nonlabens dokdonensis TaxID=328515 RepID=A0ABX5PW72_9FLAO|nr:TonB-dependent receptor [Nonlabens dokdonensis]AGC75162.1 putative TonB-dependent outer membrane receptor protein [Nonlabens dokdonensis DSW-6]PZX39094.1 hypothetical protein LX97_02460 [Nonlabens dokdonensis]
MKTYHLKFENECNENWSDMLPDHKGRFCKSCTKSVIDFTNKSTNEILDYLKKNKNTCGKMSSNQLVQPVFHKEKDLISINYSKTATKLMIAASIGAVALGNAQESTKAYSPTFNSYVEDIKSNTGNKDNKIKKPGTVAEQKLQNAPIINLKIKGAVKSKQTNKKLAKVKVTFYGLTDYISTYTDKEGNYTLNVPENLIQENNLLSYTFQGVSESTEEDGYNYSHSFQSNDIIISRKQLLDQQELLAEHEVFYLGGAFYSAYEPKPLVFVNGQKVPFRKLNRFYKGKKTEINFAGMSFKFIVEKLAIQLYGNKAKDGVYLFYNKLSE